MNNFSRKFVSFMLVFLLTLGVIPSKLDTSIGGISIVAAASNIYSQDGMGYSGPILGNEVIGTTFTGYQNWPSGFTKGSSAFIGGVYDGTNIWMIPYNANELVKVNPSTGEMTGYSDWPEGFTKGSNAFAGGVYDGTNIWLIPYSANQIIKVNVTTGVMTGYSDWPDGTKGSDQFIGGIFDGTNIWISPYSGSRLIKVNTTNGVMTSYNDWPDKVALSSYPFVGSIFDGTSIWLIPNSADHIIKVNPTTGDMTEYSDWPRGFSKSADAFWGGVFDGTNIWLIPYNSTHLVKVDTTTGDMTGYNEWPIGFNKSSSSFAGGVYDGTNIWLVPYSANSLIKVDASTGEMKVINSWPNGFNKASSAYMGGVYDGNNIWMIPFGADRLMKFGESTDLSDLELSSGTLSPVFSGATTSYTASVDNSVASIEVTPTVVDVDATVTVNGVASVSGEATTTLLNVGSNTITIVVTASSGDTKTYSIEVTREISSDANLSGLELSSGTLSPVFSGAETSYTASVDNSVASIEVTPTVVDVGATVTVNGVASVSGEATTTLLNVGSNAITIVVTASSGDTKTYSIEVTREVSSDANLSGLELSSGTLSPVFSGATTSYTASVNNSVASIDVIPTVVDVGATVTVNGVASVSGEATTTLLNVGSNAITIVVTASSGDTKTYSIEVTRANRTNNGGTPEIINTNPTNPNTGIMINGEWVNAGEVRTLQRENQTVTIVTSNDSILDQLLKSGQERPILTIHAHNDSDVLIGELNADTIKKLAEYDAILILKSDKGSYSIPAKEIDIEAILRQFGSTLDLDDIRIQVEIGTSTKETVQMVQETARNSNITILVPPMDFSVRVIYGDQQIEIKRFNEYIERSIEIPNNVDASKITTGVVIDENGLIRHVPTTVIQQDGKYFAVIRSLTNSTYSIVEKHIAFSDVANHWAGLAIKDMAARLIVEGAEETLFSPDKPITRAEFTAIVVRALGLKLESNLAIFNDVNESDWYYDAVLTASSYQLITGFEDGSFRPKELLTREQAMHIISKAMIITGLKDKLPAQNVNVTLQAFKDGEQVALWAKDGVVSSIQAGIVNGRSNATLALNSNVTRAEVTMMLQQLLKKSNLIE